jgi:hypothetical protein
MFNRLAIQFKAIALAAGGVSEVLSAAKRMARLFRNFKLQNPNFRKASKFKLQSENGGSEDRTSPGIKLGRHS